VKIRQVGAELFYADGRTDGQTDRRDEANSRFRNFAKASKNSDSSGRYTPRKFERNPNFYDFSLSRVQNNCFGLPFNKLFVRCGQSE
jgi:hypothetical protein